MPKKIGCLMLCLLLFGLTACSKEAQKAETKQEKPAQEQTTAEAEKLEPPSEKVEEESVKPISINLYAGNENADGFTIASVTIPVLDASEIANQLSNNGVIPSDVVVQKFEESIQNGDKAIDIDFNSSFLSFLQGRGSAGEYITMGSICNTYLDAYECSKIKITVDGAAFETGHSEYTEYMRKYSFE